MLYRNKKTGNTLSPANKAAEDLLAGSELYEPVKPEPSKTPPKEKK